MVVYTRASAAGQTMAEVEAEVEAAVEVETEVDAAGEADTEVEAAVEADTEVEAAELAIEIVIYTGCNVLTSSRASSILCLACLCDALSRSSSPKPAAAFDWIPGPASASVNQGPAGHAPKHWLDIYW